MYVPQEFLVTDQNLLLEFIQGESFGALLMNGNAGFPLVTQIPFVLKQTENSIILEFHLAVQNEQSNLIQVGSLAKMVVFGAHGYISSSVYTHVNVPTYNYKSAHLIGTLSLLDEAELKVHLTELVDLFEQKRENPLRFQDWSSELINMYIPEIVGVRMEVVKMTGNFKLSQNRNETDYKNILSDIEQGNPELYHQMKNLCPRK